MRFLTAIVLLLWTVCYGRCLKEQYAGLETVQLQCCHMCGDTKDDTPGQKDHSCEVCDIIHSGGTQLSEQFVLDAPVWVCLLSLEISNFALQAILTDEAVEAGGIDTGPPRLGRMCEWMASTAAPVRGPNLRA